MDESRIANLCALGRKPDDVIINPYAFPVSGGAFTPAALTGVVTWLEADTVGNTSHAWKNSIGGGNDSIGVTADPTLDTSGAFPFYTFAGGNKEMSLTTGLTAASFSAFCVARKSVSLGTFRNILNIDRFGIFYYDGSHWGVGRQGVSDEALYTFSDIGSGWRMHGCTVDLSSGVAAKLYLETTQKASGTSASSGGTQINGIARANGGYQGDIAAIVACSGITTGTEISNLKTYWNGKYGI